MKTIKIGDDPSVYATGNDNCKTSTTGTSDQKPKELDWEKEFDKKFELKDGALLIKKYNDFASDIELKDFISKTIQQQRKDLIKEIEGIKRLPNMAQNQNGIEYCSACGCPWDNIDNYCPDCATHNQALVDIIKILEKK